MAEESEGKIREQFERVSNVEDKENLIKFSLALEEIVEYLLSLKKLIADDLSKLLKLNIAWEEIKCFINKESGMIEVEFQHEGQLIKYELCKKILDIQLAFEFGITDPFYKHNKHNK